jgi:diphthine methyl ester acylhydrolase
VTHPSAILDLHFSPFHPQIVALASSTGSISLYKLEQLPRPHLAHFQSFQLFPESTLVLSLAWHPSHPHLIGCTLNTSNVAIVSLSPDFSKCTVLREDLNPHDGLEVWTLAFSPSQLGGKTMPQALYSGGDDSKLRCLTFPSLASLNHPLPEITAASAGGARGMRGHGAGVTAILLLPLGTEAGKDILLTGSYDDTVRVFAAHDYRSGQNPNPKVLAEKKLGGGVWRLKFMDKESEKVAQGERSFRVLASCMHAGARILEIRGSKEAEWTIEVKGRFEEHKSMNYASDVQPRKKKEWRGNKRGDEEQDNDDAKEITIVSTSFYDRLLCVWKYP